ncbi:hypothetical protein LTR02_002579 [Friedmanniomyces endolithicus]|uniref:Uncharacterized protein n=1 Tax=Friedmanniomyces endolithicus TaxID=329885 RepID=A0A4U0UT78_9PEZI|nr:hypothetical protein LTR02_002579 [Friedmanniomyces endolithicus]TKA39023.1 hypothetical protein B0A54_09620 [Friedmanniomyces endolithicus]
MPQHQTIDWPLFPGAFPMSHYLRIRAGLPPPPPPPPQPPKRKHHATQKPKAPAALAPTQPVDKVASINSSKWSTAGTMGMGGRSSSSGERTGTVVGRDMMPGETRYVTNEEWRDKRGRVVKKRTTVGTTRKEG